MTRYAHVEIEGIVQGVGFRPFVYRLARRHSVAGNVSNDTHGVEIWVAGEPGDVQAFVEAIGEEAPPQAVIERVRVRETGPFSADAFEIAHSKSSLERSVLISPDLATCDDCLAELFDPADRRYRYPFINCTNCGPRFTIIRDTPYDRPLTSMAKFAMCPECRQEYEDPGDRRFHAQPNACPACGPRLRLTDARGAELGGDPVAEAARVLDGGGIVAVKGLGGFHLACDATSDEAVLALRARKNRYGKPLAVMVRDVAEARRFCGVGPEEADLMLSPRRPIVLLEEKEGSELSREVAGGLRHQGIFLPYTPLHHLLLSETEKPLVMTSGNVSSEPISIDNDEALARLSGIADCFLLHDRDILVRYDDSVTRVFAGAEYPVRRARGYAPYPVRIRPAAPAQVLALGPELKNTFCFLRGEHAFIGQHIGDMETVAEVEHFEEALAAIKRLFSLEPEVIAHDLHPDYLTTHMALDYGLPRVGVQHHHAHVASCMADNALTGEVLGVAWDGTGYGEDGTVWGGEFMSCDGASYRRLACLYRYPMPGADAAVFRTYRMAFGVLTEIMRGTDAAVQVFEELFSVDEPEKAAMKFQLDRSINTPLTSSAGRAFDAAAALSGVRTEASYEGQAACELEAVAKETGEYYNFLLDSTSELWVVDTRQAFLELIDDVRSGVDRGLVAGKFHETMARAVTETCRGLAERTGLTRVVLSGGVFQNLLLLGRVVEGLRGAGLEPFVHRRVPPNDGGISLGQAVVAAKVYASER